MQVWKIEVTKGKCVKILTRENISQTTGANSEHRHSEIKVSRH